MRTISTREPNQQTAAVLATVTDVGDVVVTERGKPRRRVSTVRESDTTLTRLEREGRYTPPAVEPAPWPEAPGGPTYATDDVDAVLDEIRGDH